MSTKLLKQSRDEASFLIKIDQQTFERALIKEYRKATASEANNTASPILSNRVILKQYPRLREITKEAIDELMKIYYTNAVKELKIKPAALPMIRPQEASPDGPCVIAVQVALEPELEINQFEGLEVAYTPVIVTEEDIELQIENLHKQYGTGKDDNQLAEKIGVTPAQTINEAVRNALAVTAAEKTEYNRQTALFNALIEKNPFSLHNAIIDQQILVEIEQLKQEMGQKALADYLKANGKTMGDLYKEIQPLAETTAKRNRILIAVAQKMSPEVTEADIKEALYKQGVIPAVSEDEYEVFRKRINDIPGALGQLKQSICLGKVARHIYDKATFKENASKPIMSELPGAQVFSKVNLGLINQ